jgi:hypothetical protein
MRPRTWQMLAAALLAGWVASAAGSDKTFPVGVEVELAPRLTAHWPPGEARRVAFELSGWLAGQLFEQHPHWRFTRMPPETQAVVSLAAVEGSPDEILARLSLRIAGAGPGHRPQPIGEFSIYDPGHFDAFGRPTPAELEKHLKTTLGEFLKRREAASLEVLARHVPLARQPTRVRVPGREMVLPLPQERYGHLARSLFRVQCNGVERVELQTNGQGLWGPYDEALPAALIVIVADDLPEAQLESLEPKLVYLERYNPDTSDFFLFEDVVP